MYHLDHVTKQFQNGKRQIVALQDVNIRIEDGELLVIQGPTGHGKTTLLQMLGGLDRPSAGSVRFDDSKLEELTDRELGRLRAAAFGFVFQTFNLIPTLTAAENVEAALVPLGIPPALRKERTAETLASLGLGDRLTHLPSELSGGQQQRVAIARALVKKPRVVLADEPTGNLDEDTRDEIVDLLEKLWREHQLTLIMVTHDSSIAKRAQRIATIKKGRISVRTNEHPGRTASGH